MGPRVVDSITWAHWMLTKAVASDQVHIHQQQKNTTLRCCVTTLRYNDTTLRYVDTTLRHSDTTLSHIVTILRYIQAALKESYTTVLEENIYTSCERFLRYGS